MSLFNSVFNSVFNSRQRQSRLFVLLLVLHTIIGIAAVALAAPVQPQGATLSTADVPTQVRTDANLPDEDVGVRNAFRRWTLENVTRLKDFTEEVNIAYFIQVSESNLLLVPRLLMRLYHPLNLYIIHFDRKIPTSSVLPLMRQFTRNSTYAHNDNVRIMEREMITYRGVTMILNNLDAIQQLLTLSTSWEYFINLSGSDYPLVSPVMQRRLLALPFVRDRHANFFTISPINRWHSAEEFRFRKVAIDQGLAGDDVPLEDSHLRILTTDSPLRGRLRFAYARGEAWMILTRSACKFMVQNALARKLLLTFANSQDPSEHYYVSLFWNHPVLNATVVPHSLRTVYWNLNGRPSGQHPYVIDSLFNSRSANESFPIWDLLRSSPHFFARKFSIPDSRVLDLVDDNLNGLGHNVNQSAISASLLRVERHLHWIFGLMPSPSPSPLP